MASGQWHSQSIYMLETCLRATSEDDSLMSLLTANLAVWEWEGTARLFISLRKINTSDLRWEGELFSRVNFPFLLRAMAVRGCTRSLPPIFTGCLPKWRLVTEVMLLLNACIRQLLASNLMNPGWICMQETKNSRNTRLRKKEENSSNSHTKGRMYSFVQAVSEKFKWMVA